MSAGTAIGMVSHSLQDMLMSEMDLDPDVPVTILGPDEQGLDRRVNLFLYKVTENPFLKNLDWQVRPDSGGRLVPPPLSLYLSYVLTAYAPNDPHAGNVNAHEILGEAMRVFYEHPVVPGQYLVPGLRGASEQLRIVHTPLDLEEMSRIWSTFSQPYRTSAYYEVSVVQIDSQPEHPQALPKRVERVGVPAVSAPFQPPVVTTLTPASGPPGTTVRCTGEHLAGWRAHVSVTGISVLRDFNLTDAFDVVIPSSLTPGLHLVRISVGGLFRRVFLFDVTP
jgi:hypothetical protein